MAVKKIKPNGSLAADYKRMRNPRSMGSSYTVAGNPNIDPSECTNFLVGNFLRIAFPSDPAKTKPEFIYQVLINEYLAGMGPAEMSHDILYSQVRKLVPICVTSLCTNLESLPINGKNLQLPLELKTTLDNHVSQAAQLSGHAEDKSITQFLTYLTSLKDNQEYGSDLQVCAEYILAYIAYFASNILHSFQAQFATVEHVISARNKPRTSITSPQAVLAKYFKDIEVATYKYFTFKHNPRPISESDEYILRIIDDTHLAILTQVTSLELDRGFLSFVEVQFLRLVLIFVTQSHLTSTQHCREFHECFCNIIILLEQSICDKVADQEHREVHMTAQEIKQQIKDDLKPKPKASKTKKRRAPKKKSKLAPDTTPDTTPDTSGIKPPTILQRPTMYEMLTIQEEYNRFTFDSQTMDSQIESLNNLKHVLQESLDDQDLIQTAEVFDHLSQQFYKLISTDISNPCTLNSSSNFLERLGAPLNPPISIATRDKALAILKELQDQHTEKQRATRKVQQEITASLKTLEAVVARKFSSNSETPKQAVQGEAIESPESLDLQYIKEPLNGSNPRFSNLRDLESFFGHLGCSVEPAGKHFAAWSGNQKIVSVAISTLDADKLYLKTVAVQLYEDNKFTAEQLHQAIRAYLQ